MLQREPSSLQASASSLLTPLNSRTPKVLQEKLERSSTKFSSAVGLHVTTDRRFFEKDKQNDWATPKVHYYTPQHKLLALNEPNSADKWSFSQRVNNMKSSSRLVSPSIHMEKSLTSTLTQDRRFDNTLMKNFNQPSLPTPSEQYRNYKYSDDFNPEGQEMRLAHMNYFERQEKLLSQYKQRVNADNQNLNRSQENPHI